MNGASTHATQARDYYVVGVIGFLVGLLALPLAGNFKLQLGLLGSITVVVGFTILAPIALATLTLLGRIWPVLVQFGRFAAVGVLNTLVDLGVLNLLISWTGVASGPSFSLFKGTSFLVASTNSYFWNKFWTFRDREQASVGQYGRFLGLTLIGTLINVGVATFIVSVIGAPHGVAPAIWANVAAVLAVGASFLWNFLSYRLIIFKRSAPPQPQP